MRAEGGGTRRIRGWVSSFVAHTLPMTTGFSIRQCDAPALPPPAPLRNDLPTLKRYKDVGILARQVAVQSQAAVLCWWLTVGRYSSTCLHRTATAAGLTSLWLFVSFEFLRHIDGRLSSVRFSRLPRSPARFPRPWGVSLSGPRRTRRLADPSGWNWDGKQFIGEFDWSY